MTELKPNVTAIDTNVNAPNFPIKGKKIVVLTARYIYMFVQKTNLKQSDSEQGGGEKGR